MAEAAAKIAGVLRHGALFLTRLICADERDSAQIGNSESSGKEKGAVVPRPVCQDIEFVLRLR
jgi:hypothetical protein